MSEFPSPASTTQSNRSSKPGKSSVITATQAETSVHLGPKAILSPKANVIGSHPVKIGASAVIHPYATLDSSSGPLEVGPGCIIWERAVIGGSGVDNTLESKAQTDVDTVITKLGPNCIVEANCIVLAGAELKEYYHVEVGGKVGSSAVLSEYTCIAPLVEVAAGSRIPPYSTIIHDARRQQSLIKNATLEQDTHLRAMKAKNHDQMIHLLRTTLGQNATLR